MVSKHVVGAAFIALGLALSAQQASAGIILPSQTIVAPAEPDPTGGIVIASMTIPVSTATFSGMLTSKVIQGDPSNALGGLTFTYQLSNDISSVDQVGRFTVNSFATFLTDVSYQAPTTNKQPTLASRSNGLGGVMGFDFIAQPLGAGMLDQGLTSAVIVVQTNSPFYAVTSASVIDGSVGTVDSFAPLSGTGNPSTPEPAALSILGIGASMMLRRRR